MPAVSASAYHTEGANKKCIGIKTELVTRVPLDTGLLLHLLPEAILYQQLMVQEEKGRYFGAPEETPHNCSALQEAVYFNPCKLEGFLLQSFETG